MNARRYGHYAAVLPAVGLAACLAAATSSPKSARGELINTEQKTIGHVDLTETPHGVLMVVKASDLPAGVHALHIHEKGVCEAPSFESAGGHFNPGGDAHGYKDEDGPHAGDLPNVHISADGNLHLEVLAGGVTLGSGGKSLLDEDGSAIVLHASADDYTTDPAGDAGSRIACGIVSGGLTSTR